MNLPTEVLILSPASQRQGSGTEGGERYSYTREQTPLQDLTLCVCVCVSPLETAG